MAIGLPYRGFLDLPNELLLDILDLSRPLGFESLSQTNRRLYHISNNLRRAHRQCQGIAKSVDGADIPFNGYPLLRKPFDPGAVEVYQPLDKLVEIFKADAGRYIRQLCMSSTWLAEGYPLNIHPGQENGLFSTRWRRYCASLIGNAEGLGIPLLADAYYLIAEGASIDNEHRHVDQARVRDTFAQYSFAFMCLLPNLSSLRLAAPDLLRLLSRMVTNQLQGKMTQRYFSELSVLVVDTDQTQWSPSASDAPVAKLSSLELATILLLPSLRHVSVHFEWSGFGEEPGPPAGISNIRSLCLLMYRLDFSSYGMLFQTLPSAPRLSHVDLKAVSLPTRIGRLWAELDTIPRSVKSMRLSLDYTGEPEHSNGWVRILGSLARAKVQSGAEGFDTFELQWLSGDALREDRVAAEIEVQLRNAGIGFAMTNDE